MPSNAQKGAYYKGRTQAWLRQRGYAVALLERVLWIPRPGSRPIPVKKDQLGADLLAVNARHVVFVQVKFIGREDRRAQQDLRAADAEFRQHPCPPGAEQWIVVWTRGDRVPRIYPVAREEGPR